MKSLKLKKVFLLLSISFFLFSCINNVEESANLEEEIEIDACADITFSGNVKSIIDANCIQCHGTGGNSPNLTTFNSISSSAVSVKSAVATRRMPQGGSLTQAQIDAIVCWVNNGAPNN